MGFVGPRRGGKPLRGERGALGAAPLSAAGAPRVRVLRDGRAGQRAARVRAAAVARGAGAGLAAAAVMFCLLWIFFWSCLSREPGKTASYFVAAGRRRPLSLRGRGPVFVPGHGVMMIRISASDP